jgi:hypothetical protein
MRILIPVLWLGVAAVSSAHHAAGAVYDVNSVSEIEGTVIDVSWRNPHVKMSLQVGDGEESSVWNLEMGAVNTIQRLGVNTGAIVTGDKIRAAGAPAHDGAQRMFVSNILLNDGRELLMLPASPPRWAEQASKQTVISAQDKAKAELAAKGLFRVWTRRLSVPPAIDVTLTDTAREVREQWDPINDNPTLRCERPGMIEAMVTPSPIALEQAGQDIIIRMEEWDQARRVLMANSTTQSAAAPNPLGHSIGRWDAEILHVSTSHINWPYFDDKGTPQSEKVVIEETFTISSDEQHMTWKAVIQDAESLVGSATIIEEYVWIAGEQIKPYDCAL